MPHRVLFVDDEPNIIEAMKKTLRKETYEMLHAHSASEALELLSKETIQVVVSDEQMPGMSGSKLLTVVRQECPDTIRILLTGHASIEAATRAVNEGAIYRFLMKPCNGLDLAITIRRALQHYELMRASRKLLQHAKRETSMLMTISKSNPNLVRGKSDSSGTIILEDNYVEPEQLVEEIRAEIFRIEQMLAKEEATVT